MIYDSIVDTVGRTPVIRLNVVTPTGAEILVKAEGLNPGQSTQSWTEY